MTTDVAAVAREAVTAASAFLSERFEAGTLEADFLAGDVKAHADRKAEEIAIDRIRETYPGHAISAEEAGKFAGREDRRWVVDALDGTNNFAAGIPTFGSVVTLLDEDGPLTTAVAVPILDDVYAATRGAGATYNGDPISVTDGPDVPPSHATVVSFIGPPAYDGQARREYEQMLASLRSTSKRVIETWAPVVHWGLFARGRLGGFHCFHPAEREQVAGELLGREAGCVERSDGSLSVFARDEATLDAVWRTVADVRE